MNIVIFGANGPTGQLLTKQALVAGHSVKAITRHPQTFSLQDARLQVIEGDVFDFSLVEQAIAGQDAVLSTLGTPFSRKEITLYSQGMAHIVQSMHHQGVSRLVCVSSSATHPHPDTGGGFFFNKILQPLITSTIGRTTYEDMRRMETLVMDSKLDWTIVRPSGLFETPTVTDYKVAEGHIRGKFTSRADLANCMLQQLASDQYLHKAVAVATLSVKPNLFKLIMKEAFKKPPKATKKDENSVILVRTSHPTEEQQG